MIFAYVDVQAFSDLYTFWIDAVNPVPDIFCGEFNVRISAAANAWMFLEKNSQHRNLIFRIDLDDEAAARAVAYEI